MTKIPASYSFTPEDSPATPRGEIGGNLVLRGGLTPEIAVEVRDLDFSRVVLEYGRFPDLSPLRNRPIERMLIRGEDIDWESICSLESLVSLEIQGDARPELDSSLMDRLLHLSAYWDPWLDRSLTRSESLMALELRGPFASIGRLASLRSLKALLVIKSSKLTSLEGISRVKSITYAEFSHCSSLFSVRDVDNCVQLECLNLERCKKLTDVDALPRAGLRELALDIGPVDSLMALGSSASIEKLRFDCRIADGDLEFLFAMPALQFCLFKEARNFNHTLAEVVAFLEAKGFPQRTLRNSLRRFPAARDFVG